MYLVFPFLSLSQLYSQCYCNVYPVALDNTIQKVNIADMHYEYDYDYDNDKKRDTNLVLQLLGT